MTRFRAIWLRLRESLWFVPAVMTLAGIGGGLAMVEVDRVWFEDGRARELWLVFGAGAEGARGVLSAIASSIITVTGVVFSVTVIALQLSSTQYTPRVLRRFTRDTGNQVVLGTFIGTFTYCLIVLRSVRAPGEEYGGFVPALAVTGGVVLALVSVGCLIYFIDHITNSIKAEHLIREAAEETKRAAQPDRDLPGETVTPAWPEGDGVRMLCDSAGYVQAIDVEALADRLDGSCVMRLEVETGDYVLDGEPLAIVWPAESVDDAVIEGLRSSVVLGPERTPAHDVERGLLELVHIAVKALSPGINDPETAEASIDRMAEVLAVIARKGAADKGGWFAFGPVHYEIRRRTFDHLLLVAVERLQPYCSGHPHVTARLLEMLGRLGPLVHGTSRASVRQALEQTARVCIPDPDGAGSGRLRGDLALARRRVGAAREAHQEDRSATRAVAQEPLGARPEQREAARREQQ